MNNMFNVFVSSNGDMPDGEIIAMDSSLLTSMLPIWICTAILVVILWKVLYAPVKKFMDERSASIDGDISSAKEANNEALELKIKYEEKLVEIGEEKQKILEDAYKKARERSERIIKEAQEQAELIKKRNLEELDEERKNMEEEIKRQLIELSVLASSKFLESNLTKEDHEKYVDEALAEWEESLWLE